MHEVIPFGCPILVELRNGRELGLTERNVHLLRINLLSNSFDLYSFFFQLVHFFKSETKFIFSAFEELIHDGVLVSLQHPIFTLDEG